MFSESFYQQLAQLLIEFEKKANGESKEAETTTPDQGPDAA